MDGEGVMLTAVDLAILTVVWAAVFAVLLGWKRRPARRDRE